MLAGIQCLVDIFVELGRQKYRPSSTYSVRGAYHDYLGDGSLQLGGAGWCWQAPPFFCRELGELEDFVRWGGRVSEWGTFPVPLWHQGTGAGMPFALGTPYTILPLSAVLGLKGGFPCTNLDY